MKKQLKKLQEMKQQKKMGNKGFSLIELIIVIAIMAILIALIGLQVLPMIEKSKESKDYTTLDACYNALQVANAEVGEDIPTAVTLNSLPASIEKAVIEHIGNGVTDEASLSALFGSKNGTAATNVTFLYNKATGEIKAEKGNLAVSNKGGKGKKEGSTWTWANEGGSKSPSKD